MRSAASTAERIASSAISILVMPPARIPRETWWPIPVTRRRPASSIATKQHIFVEPTSNAAKGPFRPTAICLLITPFLKSHCWLFSASASVRDDAPDICRSLTQPDVKPIIRAHVNSNDILIQNLLLGLKPAEREPCVRSEERRAGKGCRTQLCQTV